MGTALIALATALTAATAPLPAPSGATASAVGGGIIAQRVVLTWQDNASDETGYRITRSVLGITDEHVALPAHAGTGRTGWSDLTTRPGTTYVYSIRAVRTTATGTTLSAAATVTVVMSCLELRSAMRCL